MPNTSKWRVTIDCTHAHWSTWPCARRGTGLKPCGWYQAIGDENTISNKNRVLQCCNGNRELPSILVSKTVGNDSLLAATHTGAGLNLASKYSDREGKRGAISAWSDLVMHMLQVSSNQIICFLIWNLSWKGLSAPVASHVLDVGTCGVADDLWLGWDAWWSHPHSLCSLWNIALTRRRDNTVKWASVMLIIGNSGGKVAQKIE